jgi:hypothetical protein
MWSISQNRCFPDGLCKSLQTADVTLLPIKQRLSRTWIDARRDGTVIHSQIPWGRLSVGLRIAR